MIKCGYFLLALVAIGTIGTPCAKAEGIKHPAELGIEEPANQKVIDKTRIEGCQMRFYPRPGLKSPFINAKDECELLEQIEHPNGDYEVSYNKDGFLKKIVPMTNRNSDVQVAASIRDLCILQQPIAENRFRSVLLQYKALPQKSEELKMIVSLNPEASKRAVFLRAIPLEVLARYPGITRKDKLKALSNYRALPLKRATELQLKERDTLDKRLTTPGATVDEGMLNKMPMYYALPLSTEGEEQLAHFRQPWVDFFKAHKTATEADLLNLRDTIDRKYKSKFIPLNLL